MSEESEDEIAGGESHEEMTYRRKYQMLLERCEVLQQDNERLINRIQHVYKYTRIYRKERQFLVDRLEGYNDNWKQGINQYLIDSLSKTSKHKVPSQGPAEKPFRRPSTAKKSSRQKDKEPKQPKRLSKDQRAALTEKIKIEYDSEQSSSAF